MKKFKYLYIPLVSIAILTSCGKDFLEKVPQGELINEQLVSQDGVENLLIGAYGLMNGNINGTWGNYASAPSQWLFGEVASDNAHKGSNSGDQPNMNLIERHQANSANDNLQVMWRNYYEGILRCNNTIKVLAQLQSGGGTAPFSQARATEVQAEARMLRAHYYFFLKRLFVNIPYIDESVTTDEAITKPNNVDINPKIEEDLRFAVANLPVAKPRGQAGRVNKAAAQAYLGKFLLYQKKYAEALALFKQVIGGQQLTSMPYYDNFDVLKKNGPESIFASQSAISPDGGGENTNVGDMLSGLYGSAPVNCCGFYQPTIDLVNSFKVNSAGLPFLDGSYRTNPYMGAGSTSSIAFDPRLDYTVGRQGVNYLDWGIFPGGAWIRDPAFAGPFVGIKTMIPRSLFGTYAVAGTLQLTALNVNVIRLADVILMAAECDVETSNLGEALSYVNMVRARAKLLTPKTDANGIAAATYRVEPYTVFPDQTYARNAVRFERRLELAMEGHRYYDLVRWGIAKQVIESYSAFEGNYLNAYQGITFEPRDEYYPIPQQQLDQSRGALKQNTGY